MVKVIKQYKPGGPEVLQVEDVDLAPPAPGEVRLRHTAIGVNFIDTYFRSGLYKAPGGFPFTPGSEAAGVIEAVGEEVEGFKVGDRVVYTDAGGGYAQARNIGTDDLLLIPEGVDDRTAAAVLLKGMTVQYLIRQTFKVGPEHTVLWHAGAGGVGLIAGQWLKSIGCTSIATAGSPEKVKLALEAGFTHAIDYRTDNFVERVAEITGGTKCDVVYDSVGKDTFPASLDCLKPRGLFVSFGNASGPVSAFELSLLSQKGSLFATRPTLFSYTSTRPALEACAADLFAQIKSGVVKVTIGQEFPLEDVANCHRALESRATVGATILTV
ncbi:quinone oxidoreductase family protein [Oryzibacter oryziterrae]|uniref:quinone oxidoreductase family protein n=1 Tax=Oryzibacter oryziterrae TaxID=2766474 RepID=UPI001F223D7D|nr:quinone oxidoreductase [Oryzibacter oryziterrae]